MRGDDCDAFSRSRAGGQLNLRSTPLGDGTLTQGILPQRRSWEMPHDRQARSRPQLENVTLST
jgi:hypothetical protein